MVKIRFLRDYRVQGAGGECYVSGQITPLSEVSATHFIHRGAAVLHHDDAVESPNTEMKLEPPATESVAETEPVPDSTETEAAPTSRKGKKK